jgi:hypothetical protein
MVRTLPWLVLFAALPAVASAQDMTFRSDWATLASFNDKPMWMGAAKCAAFEDTVDELITVRREIVAKFLRDFPENSYNLRDDPEWEQRMRDHSANDRVYWRRWGVARLRRDRPGQEVEALFDAQVALELAEQRRTLSEGRLLSPSERGEAYRKFDDLCIEFILDAGGGIPRIERGVADEHFRAEGAER